jgi:hypothetical protein
MVWLILLGFVPMVLVLQTPGWILASVFVRNKICNRRENLLTDAYVADVERRNVAYRASCGA